jgi:CheY-like chemotaxis protein
MENMQVKKILVVEDNDEDYTATMRAFRKTAIRLPVFRCVDGDEVIDYLYRQNQFAELDGSPYPVLILLDLNLPNTDGKTVLSLIKLDERLKRIPVVVLSTSSRQDDVDECYQKGANSYLVKHSDFARFTETIESLKTYWLEQAALPVNKG